MDDVSAAISSKAKNTRLKNAPNGIDAKIFGNVIKTSDGPAFIEIPNANTAGKIVSPVSRETSVSRVGTGHMVLKTFASVLAYDPNVM